VATATRVRVGRTPAASDCSIERPSPCSRDSARARKREDLLKATEKLLDAIVDRTRRGTLAGADDIGVEVGKVINKYKVGKHVAHTITDTSLTYARDQAKIDAEAALDDIYVLRTCVPAEQFDAAGVVLGYKNLAHVERDFRIVKVDDLDLRPVYHGLEERAKAHVLICMLWNACYLVWHLRQAWAPLTFTDEHPPQRDNPVAPPSAPPTPRPRPRFNVTSSATPTAVSVACSTTSPHSPATRSASPAPTPTCPSSPRPLPTSAKHSTSSAHPSRSPQRSQNNYNRKQRIPSSDWGFACHRPRNFGLVWR
jgi:hypothetical protein